MKNIIDTLLQRTSIRRYEMQPIEPEKLSLIYQAINNAPSSYNGQQYSVIAIDNQPLKEQIYALTGQKQIKTCALFLVFCSDYHKIEVATRQKELSLPPFQRTLDGILVGVIDATIAMSNARVMAEALGLGCCCIGYIRTAAPRELSDLLQLPKGVAIVCGLAIGHPREQPDKRPKQDEALVIHHNQYHTNGMSELLARHDRNIALYNHSHSIGTTDKERKGYRIFTAEAEADTSSFYLIETIRREGWNRYAPANGMLISEVTYDRSAWKGNTVNAEANHRHCIVPANNYWSIEGDGYNPTKHLFGTANHEFSLTSTPSSRTQFGVAMDKPLTDINYDTKTGKTTFHFRGGNLTDGIDKSEIRNQKSEFIYDLLGRRVENPSKGIYIVNGKKTVIK